MLENNYDYPLNRLFSGDWFQKRLYSDFGWPVWDTWGSGYKYYMDSRVKGRRRDEEEDE